MSERPTEVLKYTVDASQAEAGLDRLRQLMDQLKAQRAAGDDTSELEAQFLAQTRALAQVIRGHERAGGAVNELISRKRQLAAVVALAGGQFGGLIGRLGSVTSLLVSMGPAVGAAAAGLAAVSVAVGYWRQLQDRIAQTRAELAKYQEQSLGAEERRQQRRMDIEEALQARGLFSPALARRTAEMDVELQKRYGLLARPETLAAAAREGMRDVREVGALEMAARAGLDVQAMGAGGVLQELARRGQYEQFAQAAERNVQTARGAHVRDVAVELERAARTMTDRERSFLAMRDAGTLPPGVETFAQFDEFTRGPGSAAYKRRTARLREQRAATEGVAEAAGTGEGEAALSAIVNELREQREEAKRQTQLLERFLGRAAGPQVVYNQGTVIGERGDVRSRPVNPGLAPGVDVKVPY